MSPVEVEHLWKEFSLDARDPLRLRGLARRLLGRNAPPARFSALKDISFRVDAGEALGVIGANGSGKSTLLKLLCGILPPTKGRACLNGPASALIELGAGFHPDLTGRENILLNASLLGLRRRDVLAHMDDIIAFSELGTFIDQPVKRYSSGMYMRLGFAVAAHVESRVLLIDEVLAVGDVAFQQKCLARLAQQRMQGAAILFVSHDLNAVKGCCSRVAWLDRGELRAIGAAEAVIAQYTEAMLPSTEDLALRPTRGVPVEIGRSSGNGAHPGASESPVVITAVNLLNSEEAPSTLFHTADRLIIEIEYVATRPVPDPVFAFGIEDLRGIVCYGSSSQSDGVASQCVEGPGSARVVIERLPLLTGAYKVNAAVRDGATNLIYDLLLNAAVFRVHSSRPGIGMIYLEHAWEMARGPAERVPATE
jgi:ABC-type polysaccharide/polyol phosphate transport system ATPase subunit